MPEMIPHKMACCQLQDSSIAKLDELLVLTGSLTETMGNILFDLQATRALGVTIQHWSIPGR